LYVRTLVLEPKTDAQGIVQTRAVKIVGDTGQMSWLPFAQGRGATIPTPFLVVLVVRLTLLLASFGLLAPGNATARLSLAVYALSVARAVFLILEPDYPFFGVVQISGEPPRSALEQLGR
jgi:hypothetical protein